MMASETTGSGTNIEVYQDRQVQEMSDKTLNEKKDRENRKRTIVRVSFPSVNESPDEQSTPNMAQISPEPTDWTS
jgi:hypothetical protein